MWELLKIVRGLIRTGDGSLKPKRFMQVIILVIAGISLAAILAAAGSAQQKALTSSSYGGYGGATELISKTSDDAQANHDSYDPDISADGRYVVFSSNASNLVYGDTNNKTDIFIKDNQTGGINRISVSATGDQSNGSSYSPSISGNGRYIIFDSLASNLVPADTNSWFDTFRKDNQTGEIMRVSTNSSGAQASGMSSCPPVYFVARPAVSADGTYVSFISCATNLVQGDTNNARDVFLKDMSTGNTTLISAGSDGIQSNGNSGYSAITPDGRYIAFESYATNLVPYDDNESVDVFVKDRISGKLTVVSTDGDGINGTGDSRDAAITADGQELVFSSDADNLVAEDVNGARDIFKACTTCYSTHLKKSYFPWYDNITGRTWVLMAQPGDGEANDFEVSMGNQLLTANNTVNVAPGHTFAGFYQDIMDGPVIVTSNKGEALISERSLFGNSFEEVWATPYDELDSHYWWPVYDNFTPGMTNWVLVSNPPENTESIKAKVTLYYEGTDYPNYTDYSEPIAPGTSWTPNYPGYATGPVEVKAWRDGGSENSASDARKVIASQRVLYNGAFNELPGIPASKLSSDYIWTWYDNVGGSNWICIANPNDFEVYVGLLVGDVDEPVFSLLAILPPHLTWSVNEPGMGGPVLVAGSADEQFITPADLVVSQRVIWGPSFGEIAGTTYDDITASSHWTWYDMVNPGTSNWVLMSNIIDVPIYAEVRVAGELHWANVINPGLNKTPTFPTLIGGPVEVKAWLSETIGGQQQKNTPAPVFASQRVLWNGYFSEIVGKGLGEVPTSTSAEPLSRTGFQTTGSEPAYSGFALPGQSTGTLLPQQSP